jgi:hypothetical protein
MHTHYFLASPANVLCTSDRDMPNSRAIRAGVTPALKAARTAFNFPCGNGGESPSAFRCRRPFSGTEGFFRRARSSSATETNLSSCSSSRCLIAASRSLGKIYREEATVLVSWLTSEEEFVDGDNGDRCTVDQDDSNSDSRFGGIPMS